MLCTKYFSVLSLVAGELTPDLQIVVLDHAPDRLWKDLEHIKLVEEWRGGMKLVPEKWINHDR